MAVARRVCVGYFNNMAMINLMVNCGHFLKELRIKNHLVWPELSSIARNHWKKTRMERGMLDAYGGLTCGQLPACEKIIDVADICQSFSTAGIKEVLWFEFLFSGVITL